MMGPSSLTGHELTTFLEEAPALGFEVITKEMLPLKNVTTATMRMETGDPQCVQLSQSTNALEEIPTTRMSDFYSQFLQLKASIFRMK